MIDQALFLDLLANTLKFAHFFRRLKYDPVGMHLDHRGDTLVQIVAQMGLVAPI